MINNLLKARYAFLVLFCLGLASCGKDDDTSGGGTDELAASFQFEISADNFLEVAFTNFSDNATSYSWDFGDGNTSTEESPTHAYDAAATYEVVLTASDGVTEKTHSKTLMLTDPNTASTLLSGATSKTWYLQREGIALGIGPGLGDTGWWSFGGATPLGDRPCILDDAYTFHANGTFEFESNNTIFIDAEANGGWLGPGVDEGCHDEDETDILVSSAGDDLSAFGNGGSYTYEYDAVVGELTIVGAGAYIGLANKVAGADNFIPQTTKTYNVFRLAQGSVADTLHVALEVVSGADAWSFFLVSYHNPADLPEIPGAVPAASFTFEKDNFTVDFTNTSINSTNYSWDFGDGGSSADENPSYTYAAEGEYTVTLTATDDMGASDMATEIITISAAVFSPAVLSNATGKTWKLDGEGCYKVGPTPGSGEWWGGLDAAGLVERACQMDDEWIFTDAGSMEYATQGEVWAEAYMAGPNTCIADSEIVAPYDVLGSGMHAFSAVAAAGGNPAQITVTGNGAFVGFNKAINGAELDATQGVGPAMAITYDVLDYTISGGTERMVIFVDYTGNGGGYWTMSLISE